MADRRLGSALVIAAVVAVLSAVWWLDRGRDRGVRRVEGPPAAEVSWIADPAERAAVDAVTAAIDRGAVGIAYVPRDRALPPRPDGYWRAHALDATRVVVAGRRHELYYSRDGGVTFTALRGAP